MKNNKELTEAAQKLLHFLTDSYGKYILTGQQESTWRGSPDYEMNLLLEKTGCLPAIRGLDFIHGDFDGVVNRAIAWHKRGGIVTICWHTGINGGGYHDSQEDEPDFEALLTEGSAERAAMLKNWDQAVRALQRLQEADVPVLWRPFHEFDGGWFWWGKRDGASFIRLWQDMYRYFTQEKGLHNLIWVLGYSGDVREGWYPGDDYCDIIGSDVYDDSTHLAGWEKLQAMRTGKILAFHECGKVPLISAFEADGCLWDWFMVWHTEHLEKQDPEQLRAVYHDERAMTLDKLPDLRRYGETRCMKEGKVL